MKSIKLFIFHGLMLTMITILPACSDDNNEKEANKKDSGDHVWKHQTDALKSAKDMAKKMQESLNQQKDNLDDNN